MLSLFVAVILDNLELAEEIKKLKQIKAREQSMSTNRVLPLRLRIFESFPDCPQMMHLHKAASDYCLPNVSLATFNIYPHSIFYKFYNKRGRSSTQVAILVSVGNCNY